LPKLWVTAPEKRIAGLTYLKIINIIKMKKKKLLLFGVVFFAVSMFNVGLIRSNNKSLNSVTLLAKQALAASSEGNDPDYRDYYVVECYIYNPYTQLYDLGILIDCPPVFWEAYCTPIDCTSMYR